MPLLRRYQLQSCTYVVTEPCTAQKIIKCPECSANKRRFLRFGKKDMSVDQSYQEGLMVVKFEGEVTFGS